MEVLTPAIEPDFEQAGWFPGRRVEVRPWVPRDHPAFAVLETFSELKVGAMGAGETRGASEIEFGTYFFEDEDYELFCFSGDLGDWQAILKTTLVCLGEYHHGHGQLWLDSEQRLFEFGLAGSPMMLFAGSTFASGVERILRGRRTRPMLLPWQRQVTVWGETFEVGDPRVLTPSYFNVR